jgi:hypothetical protein
MEKYTHGLGAMEDHHMHLEVLLEKKMLLSTHVNALKRKGHSSTINLVTMTKMTRAQL